jgi:hypothetical protein
MMDVHKEVIMAQPCSELGRLFDTENKVNNLREDVSEIKTNVNAVCAQITELAKTVQTVVMKLDERDRHSVENANLNKTTFERFGTKIDSLDSCIRDVELKIAKSSNLECKVGVLESKVANYAEVSQKTSTLEKVVYGAGSFLVVAAGTVMFWMIQKLVG